jgi:hypothetical protein
MDYEKEILDLKRKVARLEAEVKAEQYARTGKDPNIVKPINI